MPDTRQPKKLFFGWLPQKCPTHGAKLCWQDKVRQDLQKCEVGESFWYKEAKIVPDGDLFVMKDLFT